MLKATFISGPPAADRRKRGDFRFDLTRTSGGGPLNVQENNVRLRNRERPIFNPHRQQSVRLLAALEEETTVRIPALNFAALGEPIGASVQTSAGRWFVKSAQQKEGYVKLVLVCKSIAGCDIIRARTMSTMSSSSSNSNSYMLVTLCSDDNEEFEVAPLDADFVDPTTFP